LNEPRNPARRQALRRLAAGAAAWPALPHAATKAPLRIAHVMSFDSPWRWTDGQLDGFREALAEPGAEISVFQMDVKRHRSDAEKAERGRLAREFIAAFKPDLVYASDDDAQTHVTRHYLGTRLPFVFSGVNREPAEHGFDGAPNVTGVLEREHAAETLRLLRALVPSATRVGVVSDLGSYWNTVIARVEAGLAAVPGLQLARVHRVATLAEYQRAVATAHEHADALLHLGILTLADAAGAPVPYQQVQRWVVEHSRLPDASFWIDRVHHGTLASVTVSEREQGRAAGRLARAILVDGRAPSALPMLPTTKGHPAINLARARALGITVRSTQLLQSEIVRDYEWQRAR
jgi:ABC-type uncharacterized transport system substrate-binding protein